MTCAVGNLIAVLEQERAALLSAQYDLLPELCSAKEQAVANLVKSEVTRDTQRQLQRLIRRNAGLLSHAMQGLKAVRDRLEDMRATHTKLSVYSHTGQRQELPTRRTALEKRS